jgi:NTE family protein
VEGVRGHTDSTLGLVLGGGAVLGAAHIGVLQALDEAGVEVTHVAGTSMGALVGALYAFGLSGKEIEALAGELRWPDVTRFFPSRLGLLSMDRLESLLRRHLGRVKMEDARIPVALVATDIASGEKVVMKTGDLATAATASACVPGLFIPVEREGRLLVDGGLLENLPVSPLKDWGVKKIVAVDVHMGRRFHRPRNLPELLSNALDMALANAATGYAEDADVLITPDTTSWSRAEMQDVPALVREGYRAARERLFSRDQSPG